jgi:hypothetical protein
MFKLQSKEECFQDYHYFFLNEYSFLLENGRDSSEETVSEFIKTDCFVRELPPISDSKDVLKRYSSQKTRTKITAPVHGPFKIDTLTIHDFQKSNGGKFASILNDFENLADWGDDLADFKENVERSLRYVRTYNIQKDDVFYLDKDLLDNASAKLTDNHFIYTYYLTFIVVNKERRRLLLLDYGYD